MLARGNSGSSQFASNSRDWAADEVVIHVDQEYELHDFALMWDVTPYDIRRAVDRVGCRCADVERFLKAR